MVRKTALPAKAAGGTPRRSGFTWFRDRLLPAALLVAMAFAAHSPAIGADFVWDDDINVTANPHLQDWTGLRDIWCRLGSTNMYVPVTFTTVWVEHQLWGSDPLGHHIVNIAMHALGALILWVLLRRLHVGGAWLAAAIFAVHPVGVESVAWLTELRNVQSTVCYLLCLLAYFRFAALDGHAETAEGRRWLVYALALLLFAAALLSKGAAVALPGVILLLVWWKRGRVGKADVIQVAPMFAMSLAFGLLTMYVDRHYAGGMVVASPMPAIDRLLVSSRAAWFYAGTLAWPYPLMPIYPRWEIDASVWWQYLYPLAGAAGVAALWVWQRTFGRGPLAAVLSFLLLVAPTTGLFALSFHMYTFVADRFQYHAAPALMALFAVGVTSLRQRLRPRAFAPAVDVACGAVLLLLGVLTAQYAQAFQSEKARCLVTLERNPTNWAAMNNLGVVLNAEGQHEEAVRWYQKAIDVRPGYAEAHGNLGVALVALGRVPEAVRHYEAALGLWPDFPAAHNNLGTALAALGDTQEAIRQVREALRLRRDYAEAHGNLATLLASTGELSEAIREYREALRIRPDYARAYHDLGVTLAKEGRFREAIQAYEDALRIEPGDADSHCALGFARAADGQLTEAVREYQEALRLKPDCPEAYNGLGMAAVAERRPQDAIQHFQEALRINPGYAEAHNNLGTVLASTGDLARAIRHYREAVRHRPGYAEAFVNLGKALLAEGNLQDAVRQLEDAVRLAPDYAEAHNLLGVSLAQAGRLDDAIAQFERALSIKGDYTAARENLDRARTLKRAP